MLRSELSDALIGKGETEPDQHVQAHGPHNCEHADLGVQCEAPSDRAHREQRQEQTRHREVSPGISLRLGEGDDDALC